MGGEFRKISSQPWGSGDVLYKFLFSNLGALWSILEKNIKCLM